MLYYPMSRNLIILIVIITLAIFFIFYYTSTNSLRLTSKGVSLKLNNKNIFIETTRTKIIPLTFSKLSVMQSLLSNGTYFEVATCEDSYDFNHHTQELIEKLFGASSVEKLFERKGLYALRVTLKNSQVINLFVENTNPKELKIFYGIDYEEFSKMVRKIMDKKFKEFPIGGMLELPISMTKWNDLANDFDGVLD